MPSVRLLVALSIAACAPYDPDPMVDEETLSILRSLHYDPSPPPLDPSNRVDGDPSAQRFGQRLFFDPGMSGRLLEPDNDGSPDTLGHEGETGRVSCAGCHVAADGFVDTRSRGRQVSLAAQWTFRRTPTLLDIAFAPLFNWDGRRDSLWGQAMGVIESDREFNSSRLFVAHYVYANHRVEYESIFGALPQMDRFAPLSAEQNGCAIGGTGAARDCHGKPGDGAEYDSMSEADQRAVTEIAVNVSKAIAAYSALLRCGPSRFDAWLDGDASALSAGEIRGATLFAGRGRCTSCHSGPLLSDGQFHDVGLAPITVATVIFDGDDRGAAAAIPLIADDPLSTRGEHSDGARYSPPSEIDPALEGAFRTPSLRCIASRPSFMHTGQITSLAEVISFFSAGGHVGGYLGRNELVRLGLDAEERADLEAFLRALDGGGPEAQLLEP
jgi:cytochrome c peroxidase